MAVKFDLSNKVVLVTGSSSGIGANTALAFAKAGASVVVTGLETTDNSLTKSADQCRAILGEHRVLEMTVDLRDRSASSALVDKTIQVFGKLNILVNCAGGVCRAAITDPSFMDTFDDIMASNLSSIVWLTHLCSGYLEKTRGTIINISSIRSMQSGVMDSTYCTSKASVDMFSKCMAAELGPRGIRVNCINPGAINTNFLKLLGGDPNKISQRLAKILPAGKGGEPEDISYAIMCLAAPEAAFITGSVLVSDGGHMAAGIGFPYNNINK